MPAAKYYVARPATRRPCACGCGVEFVGPAQRRYLSDAHRKAHARAKSLQQTGSRPDEAKAEAIVKGLARIFADKARLLAERRRGN